MDEAEAEYGVPAQLLEAIAWRESKFDPEALSEAGATGLMQFMPETAQWLGIDPNDPQQAVKGAAKYLTYLKDRFGGDWRKAIAAYHAGQGNVAKSIEKHGDQWLEKGDEFRLGPITRDYVEEMEPILIAMEAQPEPTDYVALDPRSVNRGDWQNNAAEPSALPEDSVQPRMAPEDYAQFNPMDEPQLDPLREPTLPPTAGTGVNGSGVPMFGSDEGMPDEMVGYRIPTGGYGEALQAGGKGLVGASPYPPVGIR